MTESERRAYVGWYYFQVVRALGISRNKGAVQDWFRNFYNWILVLRGEDS